MSAAAAAAEAVTYPVRAQLVSRWRTTSYRPQAADVDFVEVFAQRASDKPVLDMTGLGGGYDFDLDCTRKSYGDA